MGKTRVSARVGREGEMDGLFEHPHPNLQNSAGNLFIILLGAALVFHGPLI